MSSIVVYLDGGSWLHGAEAPSVAASSTALPAVKYQPWAGRTASRGWGSPPCCPLIDGSGQAVLEAVDISSRQHEKPEAA